MDEALLKRVTDSGLPVQTLTGLPVFYNDGQDDLLLWSQCRPGRGKAIVLSLPRSGTHFCSALLERLGLIYAGVHLSPQLEEAVVQDRRSLRLDGLGRPYWQEYPLAPPDVFSLVGPGQFIQGHVPFSAASAAALADFKIVLARRNLRDVAVSAMRFVAGLYLRGRAFRPDLDVAWCALPDGPDKMLAYLASFGAGIAVHAHRMAPWEALPNTFVADFDVLNGPDPEPAIAAVMALAGFLGVPVSAARAHAVRLRARGQVTPTWSGKLSDWRAFWNDQVETAFQAIVAVPASTPPPASQLSTVPTDSPERVRPASLAWQQGDQLVSVVPPRPADTALTEVVAALFSSRLLGAAAPLWQVDLQAGNFLTDGVQTHWADGALELTSATAQPAHKHLTLPLAIEELGMVTLEVLVHPRQEGQYLMLQLGSNSGFFNSVIDCSGARVTSSASHGGALGMCSAVEPAAHGPTRISLSGLLGPGQDCYARIYLCDERGNLAFTTQVALSLGGVLLRRGAALLERKPT